jgi:hypothetical protein
MSFDIFRHAILNILIVPMKLLRILPPFFLNGYLVLSKLKVVFVFVLTVLVLLVLATRWPEVSHLDPPKGGPEVSPLLVKMLIFFCLRKFEIILVFSLAPEM